MAVYGVEGDPDSDGEEEILDFPTIHTVVGSSTSSIPKLTPSSTSMFLDFQYDVESAISTAVHNGTLGEWKCLELRSICCKYDLPTRGTKAQLVQRILSYLRDKTVG